MLVGNFKFALRNIKRNRIYSVINIAGLSISLTAFILMALYIENELSFDRFNKNAADIYRVADDKQTPGMLLRSAQSAAPVAPALQREFPQIKQAARLLRSESLIKFNDKIFEERNIFFSDQDIFRIFSFNMLKGNAGNALKEPGSIVLSARMATKYFGNIDAIGKILMVDKKNMKVTGVIDNIPADSHLQFDFLISMATAEQKESGYDWLFTNWYSNNFYTYILLPQRYDIRFLTAEMGEFDKRHKETSGTTTHHHAFEKLTDIYLHSNRDNQAGKTGSLTNLYIFSAIGFFILLIACINFINLSTARSAIRAKEVAVKKVAGAARGQMIAQFLTESFLMTGIAIVLAVFFAHGILPAFNHFSGKILSVNPFSLLHITSLLLLFFIIGILSGTYPAFILSGFKPVTALKGKVSASAWSIAIRKGLVVFQFAISVTLIICSMVVYRQMIFLQKHDLGFRPSQTIVINFEGDENVKQRLTNIKQQLLGIPGVQGITASSNVPGDGNAGSWSMNFVKKSGDTVRTELAVYLTDYNYLDQFHIPVLAGRAFSQQYPEDAIESMLINETALHKLGFRSAEEAIGVTVGMYPNDAKITGVFRDFHFESLQKAVAPLTLRMMPFQFRLLSVEVNTPDIKKTLTSIEEEWKVLVPERPIEYSFLDESFNRQYETQIKFGKLFAIFTALAIAIACLGLFGLALFSVQQRTKEIGVRKVLGASVLSISKLLSFDFIKLVIVSIAIAIPVAWYAMNRWLQDYTYRINISWKIFIVAGLAAVIIALITISFQSVKAAMANPVKSLRTE